MFTMSSKLSAQEIEELRKLQCNVSKRTDYAWVTCFLMLALGSSPNFVAQSLGIDVATVYRYKKLLHGLFVWTLLLCVRMFLTLCSSYPIVKYVYKVHHSLPKFPASRNPSAS